MRLNRVESFYLGNEGNEEERQPGMARPLERGRSAVAKAPCNVVAARGGSSHPRARPATASPPARGGHPQGQQPASGRSAAGVAPAGRLLAGRSTAHFQWPDSKGLLAHSEAVGAAPARGQLVEGPPAGTTSAAGATAGRQRQPPPVQRQWWRSRRRGQREG
ncbi:hypothetical protein B296_00020601 [Ensete ventricosum]|uniref:Uncharacterized protein n=1 Tax=Ensete ventricosum TaxID=4639 RepID=A0A426YTH2_ENSVE|nr:hypothetical protein B296_00020601 [Ensete ventricosum]